MTDYPGALDRRMTSLDSPGFLYGRTGGFHPTQFGDLGGWTAVSIQYPGVDTLVAVGDGFPPALPRNNWPGVNEQRMTPAGDWFERAHLLPRVKIDFGVILTQIDRRFELFNAFRSTTLTLTSQVINTVGVVTPDMPTPPATLGPLVSFLDPLSTELAPLKQIVRALKDGAVAFDTTIDFTLNNGVGTLKLGIKGSRVVMLIQEPESPVREVLSFLTKVHPAIDGDEQRISLRDVPRQSFAFDLILDGRDRQYLQNQLLDWQDKTFGVPLWHERFLLTAGTSIGAQTFTVASTANADFRQGGFFVVLKNDRTFDVLDLDVKTGTTFHSPTAAQFAYAIGDLVMPLRLGKLSARPVGRRPPYGIQRFQFQFECSDDDAGAPAGSTAGWPTFNGKVLLGDDNIMVGGGEVGESYDREIFILDGQIGRTSQFSRWDRGKHQVPLGFSPKTRAALWTVRLLLLALRGRQKSFFRLTSIDDLTPTQNLLSGTATMTVDLVGYSRFVRERSPRKSFRITFTDGSTLTRTITDSTEISATEEQLTLDNTWPSTKTPAQVQRIEHIGPARLATDDVEILHAEIGRATLVVPARTVFDS